MNDCRQGKQHSGVTVNPQQKLLPMSSENWEHAQNNRQGQRQSQKDYQPKRYLLPEAGALGMRFFAGAFNQSNTLNKALQPRPVIAGEAAVTRPHHGQNRKAYRKKRRTRE